MKMNNRRWLLAFLLGGLVACTPQDAGSSIPAPDLANATPRPTYDPNTGVNANAAWVRVHFIGNQNDLPAAGVAALFLCAGASCDKLGSPKKLDVPNSTTGQGALFTEAVVPVGKTFDQLVVGSEPALGQAIDPVVVRLSAPVTFEPESRNELFLGLGQPASGAPLVPSFVGAQRVPPTNQGFALYRPDRALQVTLGGLGLSLEPGTFATPKVIAVEPNDTGQIAPQFNVWPEAQSNKPISFSFVLDSGRLPQGLNLTNYQARMGDATLPLALNGNTATITTNRLGGIRIFTNIPVIEPFTGPAVAVTNTNTSGAKLSAISGCESAIKAIGQGNLFELATTEASRFTGCENTAPYVHIIAMRLWRNKGNHAVTITVPKAVTSNTFELKTIVEHAQAISAIAAINGFTWDGNGGMLLPRTQSGSFKGTVITDGTTRSTYSGAEAMVALSDKNTNRNLVAEGKLFDRNRDGEPQTPYTHNVVGSTTSIVKDGNCTFPNGGSDSNLWSAVGLAMNDGLQFLVFVSSTGTNKTNATELCEVFQAMDSIYGNKAGGTVDAIRLDGSTAAGMYWKGSHLNPLDGANWMLYGSARRILSTIAFK